MRMKRTTLVLNDKLLDEATRALGAKTYSATVNTALAELLRVRKILSISAFFGQGLWQGDLEEMREDNDRGARPPDHRSQGEKKK